MKDWSALFFNLRHHLPVLISVVFLTILLLTALFANFIAPHDPINQQREVMLLAPSFAAENGGKYILGTDPLGRDILSRMLFGTRFTLLIGALVVLISLTLGVVIGLVAGFYGGFIDYVLMRLMDVILAFPSLLLALVMVAILGPGIVNSTIAIALVQLPHFVRLTRAQVMTEKKKDYFVASELIGASNLRLMLVHLLPNCITPLIVQGTLNFSNAILDAAALGFLGLGAQPPTPEWGTMLADAREFIFSAWWVAFFPGLAILVTVLAINILGDTLRDNLDPRLKKA